MNIRFTDWSAGFGHRGFSAQDSSRRVARCGIAVSIFALALGSSVHAETFELETATIPDIQKAMAAGALSSVELTSLYLNRITVYDRYGIKINAVPVLNTAVLAEAAAADARLAQGQTTSPLNGISVLVKDNIDVAGLPTTNGYVELVASFAEKDAFVIKQLRVAGAVILGKTNMPDGAAATSTSSFAGTIKNPYGLAYCTGGSSSGSAAGTAADFSTIALGSDSSGSLISPASGNNIFTLTSGLGLIGRTGVFPGADWRNVVGVLARSSQDVALTMNEIDADDPDEVYRDFFLPFVPAHGVDYTSRFSADALKGKRIGIYKAYFPGSFPAAITDTFNRFVQELTAAGAIVSDYTGPRPSITSPNTTTVLFDRNLYLSHLAASAPAKNVSVFTQLLVPRVNTQATADSVKTAYDSNSLVPWQQNQSILDYGTARLADLNRINQAAFVDQQFDALINPATTNLVPLFTTSATINPTGTNERWTGFPLAIVPAGFDGNGLPIGMQFVGAKGGESLLLALADAYAKQTSYRKSPDLTPALAGETIEYSTATAPIPPAQRPEVNAPALRVAAGSKVTGKGKKATLVLTGGAVDASGLGSLTVYVNGKKIAAKRAANWKASVKLSTLRSFVKGSAKTVQVTVVAKDVYGNTSVTTKTVKLPKTV